MHKECNLKIPGKVVINGSYIVLEGEYASCITLNRYLNINIKIRSSDTFGISLRIKGRENYSYNNSDKGDEGDGYLDKIINTSLEYINMDRNVCIEITGHFDKDFFLDKDIKTGLGSSSCIYISIVYSLLQVGKTDLDKKDFIKVDQDLIKEDQIDLDLINAMYYINNIINPNASGCDVMTSLLGPINFSRSSIKKLILPCRYIILGTFGKSTCTRKMLSLINESDWSKIKVINNKIIQENENIISLYREYLDEMYSINKLIVPDKQYKILKDTFMYRICGCGISGAGGEDAVWCITDNKEDIKKYWDGVFDYVIVCELIDHGLVSY
ncbi:hypothetical protein P3W45_001839 [Vairimorpha bombi]|jgi:mevalonate kinase